MCINIINKFDDRGSLMSGLKDTTFKYNPKAFWTFDLDRVNDGRSELYDEIGGINPMIKMGDSIYLEQQSLNNLELTDQFSMSLNIHEKSDGNGNWDNNTGMEVIDSADFAFPNDGQFTIEFLYYKARPNEIRQYGEIGYYSDIISPIMSKGSLLNISITDYYYSASDGLIFSMFGGTRSVSVSQSVYPVFERVNHVVATYGIVQVDVNQWKSTISIYMNGRLFGSHVATHVNVIPITDVQDSWYFGKNKTGTNPVVDWNTETLTLDQIAVYDYAFTQEQVMHHYRKTKTYKDMIVDDYPLHYWRMNDVDNILDSEVTATVGTHGKLYYNIITDARRGLPGPPELINSNATNFTNTSMASVTSYNIYGSANAIFNPASNYTVDFWFKTSESQRRVLLSCVEEVREWRGLTIMINSNNDLLADGRIDIFEGLNQHIVSDEFDIDTGARLDWSDNEWHHLAVKRTSTNLILYIDGKIQASSIFPRVAPGTPLQLHLMGSAPNHLTTTGQLSEVSITAYALQEMQIINRYLYTTRYKMNGYTLLQGNPIAATVRFYNHISGELVDSVISDGDTGLYSYHPINNRLLDVVSYIPENNTTRFRIHGPVKPAEYTDLLLG